MPLPEKGNSMQMCLFLWVWKWEINFLMGDFSQLSLSPQFLHSRKLEVTAIVLCWETQPFVIALIAITWVQNIISSLDYCNSFLNDPSASGPGPVESLLSTASRMILLVPANTLNPPLASQLIRVNTNKAPHNCPSLSLWSLPWALSTFLTVLQPHRPFCCLLSTLGTFLPIIFACVIPSTLQWLLPWYPPGLLFNILQVFI